MQIYALSTGSPITGALSMLLFSLGTVPLMFGLGAMSSVLSKKFTHKVMTVGAALVVILGVSMLSQGWVLSGLSLDFLSAPGSGLATKDTSAGSDIVVENGVQVINSTLAGGRYPAITVQVGTPVKWTIDAPQGSVNGCNNRMQIPEYDIEYQFKTGGNIIEFTPEKTGTFRYSCWMGMIRSSITVVEAGAASPETEASSPAEPEEFLFDFDGESYGDPTPANAIIEIGNIAVATNSGGIQQITIELTDEGFSPAVIIVQSGVVAEWTINNTSSRGENSTMLVPAYRAKISLYSGGNPLSLFPTESFDFSTGDNVFYGYVKVVDDLNALDEQAIKDEAKAFQPLIWPPEYFEDSGGVGCH
jgi:plastocyanin domain-containing protein